ncbi:MAG: branched-chain amino acid transport system II carrier protein [Spirochaetia bacterium]|jgi:LIVCS family branched-chain amino acid:cation transporter|nr:branched-chain amino acid transport system II carrier protein [Spirochaetia bacterium]
MKNGSKSRSYLPLITLFVISGAMFAGHFGVGDVIFPVILGRGAGSAWFPAALGYFIVNSLGVWLAYVACARQGQTLAGIAQKTLGRIGGGVYVAIPVMIEVFFILPRVSSATYEMSVASFFPGTALWLFLIIYFLLNFYLAFSRAKVIDRIGKVLAPLLIAFVVILLLRGIFSPGAPAPSTGMANAVGGGMLNGYNTMNAIAAFLFGGWILNELSLRNVTDKREQDKNLTALGLLTAVALGVTSTGLVYLGATTGSLFPEAAIGTLSVDIAASLLGVIGKAIFAVLIAFACLTTSASITSMAGDMLKEVSKGKIKYVWTTAAASIIGFIFGLVGLSRIVRFTIPWLMLLYPSIVVLILASLSYNFDKFKKVIAAGVITSLIFSIGDFLTGVGFPGNIVSKNVAMLPLGKINFGWLIPTVAVMIIVYLVTNIKKKSGAAAS